MKQWNVITGVIGTDPHIVGSTILTLALDKEKEFKVTKLGAMVSPEEFIHAAIETKADAVMISSLSGFAEIYLRDFREKCHEAGLENILIYVGGYLVIGKTVWEEIESKFKSLGINRVYPPDTLPETVVKDLRADLGIN
ncbi:MAG: methylaspartate mutase subunit S [Deltaproteobacteria bacterium]|nr:methylaspartate mutase subunit S [Deltaproteobacteria bacterium]